MSIFGDRAAQGSFQDARQQQGADQLSLRPHPGAKPICGTCTREIFPQNLMPGIGDYFGNYCQCQKAQAPQER